MFDTEMQGLSEIFEKASDNGVTLDVIADAMDAARRDRKRIFETLDVILYKLGVTETDYDVLHLAASEGALRRSPEIAAIAAMNERGVQP